jgi:hypothetical protein
LFGLALPTYENRGDKEFETRTKSPTTNQREALGCHLYLYANFYGFILSVLIPTS